MSQITVIKRNVHGQETWRYQGRLLEKDGNKVVLEAFFDRKDTWVGGLLLATGDRFLETYYTDRWYNFFEIHARQDDRLRGWYCNIGCPAEIDGDTLSYVDLALDLVVLPGGQQVILDEDEFEQLEISPDTRTRARTALSELQHTFRGAAAPG